MEYFFKVFLQIELSLFAMGFMYGFLAGNKKLHPLFRAVTSGLIFTFLYVTLPAYYVLLKDSKDDKA